MKDPIGYRIFFRYLELIWEEDKESFLGCLLGGMSFLNDGSTADPAYAFDWDDAVEKVPDKGDAYQAGIQFLTDWLNIGYDADISKVCSDMKENKRPELWQRAVEEISDDRDDPYLTFVNR